MIKALIFDCDGVLVDTERDAHRVGFNLAFKQMGIDAEWDVDLYGRLLLVAGGKERMRAYFDEFGWPAAAETPAAIASSMIRRIPGRTGRLETSSEVICVLVLCRARISWSLCSAVSEPAGQPNSSK